MHDHVHGHNNGHSNEDRHEDTVTGRPLKITLVLVLVIMAAEVVGGLLSNSLALLSDAGHMLTDALALVLSLFAIMLARRPANPKRTFGYYRVEILAAFANGAVLILLSAYIFFEAIQRFSDKPEIKGPLMLVVAIIGLAANLVGMALLRQGSKHSINVRAAFWHIIGDTMSSVGVIIGAIIIYITGWTLIDPILAMAIALVILFGAWRIVKEAVDILLESVPKDIKMEEVLAAVKRIDGVEDLHEVHIWTLTSGIHALSAHLKIADQKVSESGEILARVTDMLAHEYNISHTTLQMECEDCPTGTVCNLPNHDGKE
jgi:cobalt-zinc-cadmium efflux system protein